MTILTKIKNLLFESLGDNKKLIIALYALFIVCFIIAWLIFDDKVNTALNTIQNSNTNTMNTTISAIDLFINNEWRGILTYVTSVFFGISAIVSLLYNGIQLGAFGPLFAQLSPKGGIQYIIYLIPHGIFEITATVLESVAGILLFLFIWRFIKAWRSNKTQGVSDSFDKTKKVLIQSIVLMIFSTILLIIAAPIEAYVSIPFSEFILGI